VAWWLGQALRHLGGVDSSTQVARKWAGRKMNKPLSRSACVMCHTGDRLTRIMVDFSFSHKVASALSLRNTNGTPTLIVLSDLYHLNSFLLNLLEISLAAGVPAWLRNIQVVNRSSHKCDTHLCCATALTSTLNFPFISQPRRASCRHLGHLSFMLLCQTYLLFIAALSSEGNFMMNPMPPFDGY
jgi:hypothetical protein